MFRPILVAAGLSFALMCSVTQAQTDSVFAAFTEMQNSSKSLPDLTAKRVKKWISSYKASQKLNMPELQQSLSEDNQSAEEVLEALKTSKQYGKLNSIVKSAGFTGVEHWTQVSMQVVQAYAAVTINKNEVNQQLKNTIAEIQKNSGLSEQQKQMMIAMAKQAGGMLDSVTQSSDANKKAVKANLTELKALFDDQ